MFFLFCVVFVASSFVWTLLNASVAGKTTAVEIFKGITTGLAQTVVVLTTSSSHPWFSLGGLLAVAACLVFYVCWAFRIGTFRMRQIIAFAFILVILLTAMWAAIEAIRFAPGVGPVTVGGEMLLLVGRLATIVAIALVVARVLSTFGRSTLVKVTIAFAAFLAVVALGFAIYGGLSNIKFKMPFSAKSVASAAKDEPEGNFILKWLGLSGEEAEVPEDESSVAEVDGESAVPDDDAEAKKKAEAEAKKKAEAEAKKKAEAEAKKKAEAEAEAKKKAEAEEVEEVKWGTYERVVKGHPEFTIYNFPLTTDDDPDNNSYFGPNIYDPNKTATEYWKTIKEMMEKDPLILAESIATADEARHTDLCGAYYNGDDAEWAEAINRMVEDFFDEPGTFVNLSERFINMLNNETRELQLVHLDNVQDQYFLDIYTRKGIPRLVVCETHQSGDILIAWTRTKGGPENDVGLGFRLQCGNVCAIFLRDGTVIPVSEEMNIPTEEVPEMPKGYDPPEPKPAATPTPKPTAAPTPTPVPGGGSDPAKDPSKAPKENTERNDDPGTGKATNNGVGATKSAAASESQKASDGGSVADYDRKVEQNRSANAGGSSSGGSGGSGSSSSGGQKSGGENNKPSQSASGAKQDNNGNAGNGGGSIDKPTAKSEAAVSADTNQSVDASGAAGGMIAIPD